MEDTLRKLVAFPTVSGNKQAMHELLTYVADFVTERGLHVSWHESNGFESLVATTVAGSKTPKVMLAAHADVVPGGEELFTLRKADGNYYGRGVVDMKFAIAAYLHTIDELRDEIANYDLGLMITSDEEIGGTDGVGMLVDQGYIPQVCVLPDGGDNWQVQTGSKGVLIYQISISGITSHGSRPWHGDNALTKLIGLFDEIRSFFPAQPGPDTNTISLTSLGGGTAVNQIPAAASMTLDVRTVDSDEYARIHQAILDVCATRQASCQVVSDGVPTSFDLDDPLIVPFARIIHEVTGTEVEGFYAMGSSDARFYVPYGTPCAMVYPKGGGNHSDGEWLDVQAFGQFKDVTKRYLDEVARIHP